MARWDEKRGTWRVVVDAGTPGEKRRRRYRDIRAPHTTEGRRQAELAEARLRVAAADARAQDWPGLARGTFAEAAAEWLERGSGRWSPKTLKETRYSLRRYILPTLGGSALERITPAQVERLYARWASEGRSASAMRRWHGIVRTIFADAERLGQTTTNPMRRVRPAGGRAPERRIPEPSDIRAAIDAAPNPMAAAYFELAATTGARRGTLVALRWGDVNLETGHLSFVHAVAESDDGPVLKTNKAGSAYAVSLAGPALVALRDQRRRAAETALALGAGGSMADLYVFSDDGGATHWNPSWPTHVWHEACRQAGVAPCRLHDLRHFSATRLLAGGVPVRVVADRLGCTEANVMRTYSHRVPSPEDARAAEIMAALFA
jgi:integrase